MRKKGFNHVPPEGIIIARDMSWHSLPRVRVRNEVKASNDAFLLKAAATALPLSNGRPRSNCPSCRGCLHHGTSRKHHHITNTAQGTRARCPADLSACARARLGHELPRGGPREDLDLPRSVHDDVFERCGALLDEAEDLFESD